MPNFCYQCGDELTELRIRSEDRMRQACLRCGYVHYVNPKVHVTVAAISGERILWVRRASEPRSGCWELPGGFMEIGEGLREAGARELWEEAGIRVNAASLQLYVLATLEIMDEVHVLFRTNTEERKPLIGPEISEAAWFSEQDAPWHALAFPQVEKGLRLFYRDLACDRPGLYYAEQSPADVYLENLRDSAGGDTAGQR